MHIDMTADSNSAVQTTEPGSMTGLVAVLVQVSGTFGGGTLALQLDLGSGFVTEYEWTAAGSQLFELPAGASYRFNLSGATGANLDIEVR